MPPHGLYPMPHHHNYGSMQKRAVYNSNDFRAPEVEHDSEEDQKASQVLGGKGTTGNKHGKRKAENAGDRSSRNQKRKRDVGDGGPRSPQEEPKKALDRFEQLLKVKDKEAKNLKKKARVETRKATNRASENTPKKVKLSDLVSNIYTGLERQDGTETSQKSNDPSQDLRGKRNRLSGGGVALDFPLGKRTPVPLPGKTQGKHVPSMQHPSSSIASEMMESPSIRQTKAPVEKSRMKHKISQVMIPETPPSRAAKALRAQVKTSIPFPPLKKNASSSNVVPPKSGSRQLKELTKIRDAPINNTVLRVGLSQPERLTEQLNDKPKPRPRANTDSQAGSTEPSSRASSVRIPEMFSRMAKIQTPTSLQKSTEVLQNGVENTNVKKNTETSLADFDRKFKDLRCMVNFKKELEFLDLYIDWCIDNHNDNFPPSCLGTGSGCSAKKEEILRLRKEGALSFNKLSDSAGTDTDCLKDADRRFQEAEVFLIQAVRAQIPVGIGRIDGVWTLYCPKYSEHHVDRYGNGMRTIEICPTSGSKNRNMFTATLHIPPRSLAYSTRAFAAPPHASFRVTTVITTAESYEIDIIFLGNGYLQARVDLNLLLRGKPTETVGEKQGTMEFIGVHEQAMW